jgi:hypothetical protein
VAGPHHLLLLLQQSLSQQTKELRGRGSDQWLASNGIEVCIINENNLGWTYLCLWEGEFGRRWLLCLVQRFNQHVAIGRTILCTYQLWVGNVRFASDGDECVGVDGVVGENLLCPPFLGDGFNCSEERGMEVGRREGVSECGRTEAHHQRVCGEGCGDRLLW